MKRSHDDTDASNPHYDAFGRRSFIIASGIGATMLAGCTDLEGLGDSSEPTDDGENDETGTFRLLISDQPNAIDDFDELNVTFDEARVFPGDDEDDDDEETPTPEPTPTPTPNETVTPTPNSTATDDLDVSPMQNGTPEETPTPDETPELTPTQTPDEDDEEDDDDAGFYFIDISGKTVDLTEVVGDVAVEIFEGELDAGSYQKLELHVDDVEGILTDGESASVKVPSEKLQIVHGFEVEAGETVSFVFDINVVAKGQTGEYNLLPVISGSGVAGSDVDVEETDPDEDE